MELNCPDMIDFDKDNTSDICYDTDYKTFSKLSTISIKGEMEYDLPLDAKEYLNENYAHSSDVYYIIFRRHLLTATAAAGNSRRFFADFADFARGRTLLHI